MVSPDIKYGSLKLEKFINSIMWSGKKTIARSAVYDALELVKEKEKVDERRDRNY